MSFKVKFQGNRAMFSGLTKKMETLIDAELEATSLDIQAKAVTDVPVDLGILKNSINQKKEGKLSYSVFTKIHYAPYVEFGTGARVDVPKGLEDYAIKFKGEDIKQVNLPARSYLYNNWRLESLKMIERLKKQLNAH